MTEMILDVLDKKVDTSSGSQQHTKGLSSKDDQKEVVQGEELRVSTQEGDYPDLFLPIMENYRISDHVFVVIWTVFPQIITRWF